METVSFDESKVKKGVKVTHKAFGSGVVKRRRFDSDRGCEYVVVSFKDSEREFPFPFAFVKGFMKIDE